MEFNIKEKFLEDKLNLNINDDSTDDPQQLLKSFSPWPNEKI